MHALLDQCYKMQALDSQLDRQTGFCGTEHIGSRVVLSMLISLQTKDDFHIHIEAMKSEGDSTTFDTLLLRTNSSDMAVDDLSF
ncbi:uncharacterized protein SPSK_02834 [Sporothrix schenckii 1099-18]|uniref:Uncharacterized protein n=1 Tax=Sporothrix schenckii 1099-18 TaxID=1397361 RepID=A0A0F2MAV6_SPOSC|nr:uncharacterized protein SPSK_02834 [Sporothrix schenckii 1099-18]KJR86777.1 hypothetical protein SPSK_02834 [Sporothrix schenckii 1099-18]